MITLTFILATSLIILPSAYHIQCGMNASLSTFASSRSQNARENSASQTTLSLQPTCLTQAIQEWAATSSCVTSAQINMKSLNTAMTTAFCMSTIPILWLFLRRFLITTGQV